jgi:peptide/nickel transport system permease protein
MATVADIQLGPTVSAMRGVRRAWGTLPITARIGVVIVAIYVAVAALAPVISPFGPTDLDFSAQLAPPSLTHLLGTDENGRDIFTRCLYGLRLDLLIVFALTYVPLPVGVIVGATAGYMGGWPDAVLSRIVDVMISFPFIILVIAVIAVIGPGVTGIIVGIPIVSWALYARLARSEMRSIRGLPYMEACEALGYTKRRTILRHGLPNITRTSLVYSTVDLVGNLLALSALSYLGLGVQPPTPELGSIIAEGQPYLLTGAWWVATLPGLILVIFAVGVGMIGEGLSDGGLIASRS